MDSIIKEKSAGGIPLAITAAAYAKAFPGGEKRTPPALMRKAFFFWVCKRGKRLFRKGDFCQYAGKTCYHHLGECAKRETTPTAAHMFVRIWSKVVHGLLPMFSLISLCVMMIRTAKISHAQTSHQRGLH